MNKILLVSYHFILGMNLGDRASTDLSVRCLGVWGAIAQALTCQFAFRNVEGVIGGGCGERSNISPLPKLQDKY
jgi:hypothetical protein